MTDVPGVLRDKDDISTKFTELDIRQTRELVADGIIAGGMIPKYGCLLSCSYMPAVRWTCCFWRPLACQVILSSTPLYVQNGTPLMACPIRACQLTGVEKALHAGWSAAFGVWRKACLQHTS